MRISDWSSDVCSSDLGAMGITGKAIAPKCAPTVAQRASPEKKGAEAPFFSFAIRGVSATAASTADAGRRRNAKPAGSSGQIGRASCTGRGEKEGEISVVPIVRKQKKNKEKTTGQ